MNTITDFLRAVEDSVNSARPKAVVRKNNARRAADKANKAVDTVFYAAKDESPEDEAKRKKGEISKMLGRDEDMGRKLVRGASRSGGLSGADVEAAMQMGAKGRDIEAATQMAADEEMGRKLVRGASRSGGLSGADVEAAMQMGAKGRDIEAATQMAADEEMGRKLVRGASRSGGLSGADVEAAMQMGAKGRDIEAATQMAAGKPPKAKVVAEDELMQSFFAKAHGSNFDPNSRVDKAKMQKILGMVNAQPELLSLTPGKFAVKLYTAK